MNRHKILLTISLLSRIGTGMISLFVLARGLGPTDYGFVATVFAYASIAALLTDFGFSLQALRDIGAEPHRAGELIAACVRVKNILVLIVTVIAVGILLSLRLDTHLLAASLLIYASIIIMSYGELVVVALRGIGRYETETYTAVAGAAMFVIFVGGTASLWPDILPTSLALFAARLAQTAIAFLAVTRHTKIGNCLFGPLLDLLRFAHTSSALALDSVLTTMAGQIDVVFVSAIAGFEATGVYQAATRLANYALLPIQVLAGVYTPKFSYSFKDNSANATELRRMRLEFMGLGVVLGALFGGTVPFIAGFLLGEGFAIGPDLAIALGCLIALRFIAASWGIALTARRGTAYRLWGQGIGLIAIVVIIPLALPRFGLVVAPIAMICATCLTLAIYIYANFRLDRRSLEERVLAAANAEQVLHD